MTYRLMAVDDEQPVLNALSRVIGRIDSKWLGAPCHVKTFTDPVEALVDIQNERYDLIVTDLRMPGMNGLDFLRRAIEHQPDIARIIISGYADMPMVMAAINDIQVFRFVSKPWVDGELQLAILQTVHAHALRRENQRLADIVRAQKGLLWKQRAVLNRLEADCPGITRVERDESGAIYLDIDD